LYVGVDAKFLEKYGNGRHAEFLVIDDQNPVLFEIVKLEVELKLFNLLGFNY
jgi:hypothetical protein